MKHENTIHNKKNNHETKPPTAVTDVRISKAIKTIIIIVLSMFKFLNRNVRYIFLKST